MTSFVRQGSVECPLGTSLSVFIPLGFSPKLIMLWSAPYGALDTVVTSGASALSLYGTSGISSAVMSGWVTAKDGTITASSGVPYGIVGTYHEILAFNVYNASGILKTFTGVIGICEDGFQIDYTSNIDTTIYCVAFGGDDLLVDALEWRWTSTGNKTVSGLAFQPDVVLHFATNGDGYGSSINYSIGAMDNGSNQFALSSFNRKTSMPTDTFSVHRTDRCIYNISSGHSITQSASFVSMNADGFTINVDTYTASGVENRVNSFALKGPVSIGTFVKGVGASQSITGLGSFIPHGGLLLGHQLTAGSSVQDSIKLTVGGFDTLKQASSTHTDLDNKNPSEVYTTRREDSMYIKMDSSSVVARASYAGSSSGQLDIDWPVNDGTTPSISYILLGGTQIEDSEIIFTTIVTQLAVELLIPTTIDIEIPEIPICPGVVFHEIPDCTVNVFVSKSGTLNSLVTDNFHVVTIKCESSLFSKSGTLVKPCL